MVSNNIFDSPWVGLGVGLAMGAGGMIVFLAKWGAKIFCGSHPVQSNGGQSQCPYAGDHPKLLQFMGESLQDRRDLREFLEEVSQKVMLGNSDLREMKGKLDLLLQGARVRWNGALPRTGKDNPDER